MASFDQAARPGPSQKAVPPAVAAAAAVAVSHHGHSGAPQGTFVPGTKIQVGGHRVVIQKYLSEGGFAHVYLVKMPTAVDGTDLAVLKRVAVPDKESLRGMRTEVETMKRLMGHRAIVTYIDSHASEMHGGGYEVFLLMEYCGGGGLMDYMNTRLQHRLTEPEILGIFSDVAEGVACMHYLRPPLLHRDLKVENVLISSGTSSSGSGRRRFKLCDFGSAAPPRPAPVSVVECRLVDEDVQKHTTLQYRSPEMVDVYRRQPISEKADIWALGVLLYKLCYYTTPFEDQSSQLAILNASYRFPSHPVFSDRIKALIASMLRENQQARPNIYEVLREACAMQGKDVPIKNIYTARSQSESGAKAAAAKPVAVGAVFAPPVKQQQIIPEVVPMRRGRPTAPAPRPTPSPRPVTSGDPFAALDAGASAGAGGGGKRGVSATPSAGASRPFAADELSTRFPTLDQFALLHDQGAEFSFEETVVVAPVPEQAKDLGQRVAERLADDAFAATASASKAQLPSKLPAKPPRPANTNASPERSIKPREVSRASAIISSTPELRAISAQKEEPPKQPPRPEMVSTGTMTSPSPPLPPRDSTRQQQQQQPSSSYHVFHFPTKDQSPPPQHRASSVPRKQHLPLPGESSGYYAGGLGVSQPSRSRSQLQVQQAGDGRHPSSSRPSLEGGRPGPVELDQSVQLTQPRSTRSRPASAYLESNMDYLREREGSGGATAGGGGRPLLSPPAQPLPKPSSPRLSASISRDEPTVESNVDFLRAKEDDSKWDKGHHLGKHSSKRTSLPSLSGTKSMLAGKFGDAFKRFETNTGGGNGSGGSGPARTPSPLKQTELPEQYVGNGGNGGGSYDTYDENEQTLDESDMSPEMRREMERRRLSIEEKRVAAAGVEYRQRLASRGNGSGNGNGNGNGNGSASTERPPALPPKSIGGVSRAVSIQHRVQSLLSESQMSPQPTRTAQGYGHFTDETAGGDGTAGGGGDRNGRTDRGESWKKPLVRTGTVSSIGSGSMEPPRSGSSKPAAKPKPLYLSSRTNTMESIGSGRASLDMARPGSPTMGPPTKQPINSSTGRLAKSGVSSQLMAVDLPGQPVLEGMSLQDRDDYLEDFQRRFPSLTTIEMVERDLGGEEQRR